MRKTGIMAGRIVALVLAFVLGFFSAFGAAAGGIYLAYSKLSIDKIVEWNDKFGWGLDISTDLIVNPDADKPVTTLTLEELFAEIQGLKDTMLTLDEMINRYGLLLPPETLAALPPSLMNEIPISDLFGPDGMDIVMSKVTVVEILGMIPEDIAGSIISDPAINELSDNTLADIVAMDMGYVFNGIELGYVTGVQYELDENGEYQVVPVDPDNPTLLEIIAPLDLGGILSAVSDEEGDVLEVIANSIGDVAVQSLFGADMAEIAILSSIIGEATIADIIVLNPETNEYEFDVMTLFDGKKVGVLLGYTEVPLTDSETGEPLLDPETQEPLYEWQDADGKKIGGVDAVLADIPVDDIMNGTFSADSMLNDLVLADILGFEKGENLPVYKKKFLHLQVTPQLTLLYKARSSLIQ